MPEPVVRAIQDHITLESRIGGYEAADARRDAVQGAYQSVAALVGTQPENIAFTENATATRSSFSPSRHDWGCRF
jgi:selenocysteine lyase/cysteine desulfurase